MAKKPMLVERMTVACDVLCSAQYKLERLPTYWCHGILPIILELAYEPPPEVVVYSPVYKDFLEFGVVKGRQVEE